ncbi:hypothetical protein STENM327S_07961 [Streptomyces tendae]
MDITGRFRQEDLTRLAALVIERSGPHSIESEHDHLTLERDGDAPPFDLSRSGFMPRR